ncbi:MAG: type II toxin-antitoxin system death-on-curing family toxin [Solirubrobacterales bacterium]
MVGLEDFLLAAEAVLHIDAHRLERATKISLAESALAAPFASFGGQDFYEHPLQRAAVLASRIMRNHPLPDGNKRVALILMDLYLEQEGFRLEAAAADIDRTLRAVAASEMTGDDFVIWLQARTARIEASP